MATLHVGPHSIHASKAHIECCLVAAVWVISTISAAILLLE
jgi:hypothetical protein